MSQCTLLLFGGRSGEHEISLRSAYTIYRGLKELGQKIYLVGIDHEGRWHAQDQDPGSFDHEKKELRVLLDQPEVFLKPSHQPGVAKLFPLDLEFDLVFPMMHGSFYEDGCIQGLFELCQVPYVGAGVASSAVGMNKVMAKQMVESAGLPVVPYLVFYKDSIKPEDLSRIGELGFPVFVKPAQLGSSVGVYKIKTSAELQPALKKAFLYDDTVLIEKGIDAQEIEVAVLESMVWGGEPIVSVPGEVSTSHEFYSYEAKYLDDQASELCIPARISEDELQKAQNLASAVYRSLSLDSMARVDLFRDRVSGQWYLNEVNTLPGFTSISMYPRMMEASGKSLNTLIFELCELGRKRFERKSKLIRIWTQK